MGLEYMEELMISRLGRQDPIGEARMRLADCPKPLNPDVNSLSDFTQ